MTKEQHIAKRLDTIEATQKEILSTLMEVLITLLKNDRQGKAA